MSKRIRNRGPSEEKIQKAVTAYKIAKYLVGDEIETLITNIIQKHPDTFISAVKGAGITDISWKGLITWIDENKDEIDFNESPSYLKPSKMRFIKMHRELTGSGLKQSKEAVEEFMREKGWDDRRWDDNSYRDDRDGEVQF